MNAKDHARIIWAIASKDILDAVRNKTLLAILFSVAFLMLSSQAIGLIAGIRKAPLAYVFDPGSSAWFQAAVTSSELRIVRVKSLQELTGLLGASADTALGISLPADVDAKLASEEKVVLATYAPWRLSAGEISAIFEALETALDLPGAGIVLNPDPLLVYPPFDSSNYPMMIGFGMVIGVMTIGMILTPYLLIDEKSSHTLEAMLVSPAGYPHMLAGKLITGVVYSLTGSAVIVFTSRAWFAHWGVLFAAIFFGAVSAGLLGLLLGTLFNHPTSLNMVGGLLIAAVMLPMYFWPQALARLSPTASSILSILPSIPMYRLVRLSMTENPETAAVLGQLAALAAMSGVTVLLLRLRVAHMENG